MAGALHATRASAYRMVYLAAVTVVTAAVFFLIFRGVESGYSVLLGGAIWLLPSFYVAYRLFAKVKPAQQIIRTLYRAEVVKLLVSALLFVMMCKFLIVNVLALLIGYMIAQLAFWLTPLVENRVLK